MLVRRMERDTELKRAFGSYVLIGETLRAPGGTTRATASRRGSRPCSRTGTRQLRRRSSCTGRRLGWLKPAAAVAVAAGTALCRRAADASDGRRAWRRLPTSMRVRTPSRNSWRPTARAQRRRRASGSRVIWSRIASLRRRSAGATSGPAYSPDPGIARVAYETAEALDETGAAGFRPVLVAVLCPAAHATPDEARTWNG